MTLLTDIAARIEADGNGIVGTTIFVGRLPDSPDNCTAIYEYTGQQPLFTHDDPLPHIERPRFQVTVRNASYAAGRAAIETIYRELFLRNVALTSARYLWIVPLQQPFYLRRDDNERVEFVVNFECMKALST